MKLCFPTSRENEQSLDLLDFDIDISRLYVPYDVGLTVFVDFVRLRINPSYGSNLDQSYHNAISHDPIRLEVPWRYIMMLVNVLNHK